MKKLLIVVGVLVVLGLIFGNMYISARNEMVRKNEAINAAWSQVDVDLQRRADLIPNLVETAKGYAAQEVTVFSDIANARAAMLGASSRADKIQTANQFESAISKLMSITEAYPQLKADSNFARLQDELAGTENRLAVERKRYNDAVQQYNTDIKGIPGAWWARVGGFQPKEYFKAAAGSQSVPKVSFE